MDQVGRNCGGDRRAGEAMKTNIRRVTIAQAGRRGISTNAMAVLVTGKVHRSHVYDFIGDRKELTTEKANVLLDALGLQIVPDDAGP